MNPSCGVCGLRFLRESGYFLGAMYISYGLGVATVLPVAVLLAVVLQWHLAIVLVVMFVQTLISMPLFFRLSRTAWLHGDQLIDPR
jgi:ABC-type multidrug transport system permease subunit